jgi:hypothetical protein
MIEKKYNFYKVKLSEKKKQIYSALISIDNFTSTTKYLLRIYK